MQPISSAKTTVAINNERRKKYFSCRNNEVFDSAKREEASHPSVRIVAQRAQKLWRNQGIDASFRARRCLSAMINPARQEDITQRGAANGNRFTEPSAVAFHASFQARQVPIVNAKTVHVGLKKATGTK